MHSNADPDAVPGQGQRSDWDGTSVLKHGVLLEIHGLGVLITGASGIGKSALALELISRGHRLIADDAPELTRVGPEIIEGVCPAALQDFLSVYGLGILNIRRLFGNRVVKRKQRICLIINLVKKTSLSAEERLRGARNQRVILGVKLPVIDLTTTSGCNLAVLAECAVRDHIMRRNNHHAEQELAQRLDESGLERSGLERSGLDRTPSE